MQQKRNHSIRARWCNIALVREYADPTPLREASYLVRQDTGRKILRHSNKNEELRLMKFRQHIWLSLFSGEPSRPTGIG